MPIFPAWSINRPGSATPAIELSSEDLVNYFNDVDEYALIAERCADKRSVNFKRKRSYFLRSDTYGTLLIQETNLAFSASDGILVKRAPQQPCCIVGIVSQKI